MVLSDKYKPLSAVPLFRFKVSMRSKIPAIPNNQHRPSPARPILCENETDERPAPGACASRSSVS
jgi:hypothetical protein